MREFLEFDTCPSNETCVQVSQTEDYMPAMRAEAKRFLEMMDKRFWNVPGEFRVSSQSHDFGSYLELRYYFDDNEEGWNSCNFVESNFPETWDDDQILTWTCGD
jgi:hypothetical protein